MKKISHQVFQVMFQVPQALQVLHQVKHQLRPLLLTGLTKMATS